MTRPCANCPWRRSTPREGFPGGYIDTRRLRRMADGASLTPAMGCHARERVCVGFALVVGTRSLGFRLATILGAYDPSTLASDAPLHTLASVIKAHGTLRPRACAP